MIGSCNKKIIKPPTPTSKNVKRIGPQPQDWRTADVAHSIQYHRWYGLYHGCKTDTQRMLNSNYVLIFLLGHIQVFFFLYYHEFSSLVPY